jgi:uncharacterized membrane protein
VQDGAQLQDFAMAKFPTPRSLLATMVGYLLVAVIAYVLFRTVLGSLYWLVRTVILFVAIVGLTSLWLKLKAPDDKK